MLAAKLTDRQELALLHRLELVDCLAEVLSDDSEGPAKWTSATVEAAAWRLLAYLKKNHELPHGGVSELEKAILVDCVEGSTWVAGVTDLPQHRAGAIRTLRSLAEKMVKLGYAEEVDVPLV